MPSWPRQGQLPPPPFFSAQQKVDMPLTSGFLLLLYVYQGHHILKVRRPGNNEETLPPPPPPSLQQNQAKVSFFIWAIPFCRILEGISVNTHVSTKVLNSDDVSSSKFGFLLLYTSL